MVGLPLVLDCPDLIQNLDPPRGRLQTKQTDKHTTELICKTIDSTAISRFELCLTTNRFTLAKPNAKCMDLIVQTTACVRSTSYKQQTIRACQA